MKQLVFDLSGANNKSYKKCIYELNNMHLSGNDRYPKSVEAAMTYMSHYMDKNQNDKSGNGIQLMQQKTIKCWLCQEDGHKANECPKKVPKETPKSKINDAKIHWTFTLGK